MNGRRDEFLDLCAAHAFEQLDAVGRARLDELLAQGGTDYDERLLAGFVDGALAIAAAAPHAAPRPELKARLLAAIEAEPSPPAERAHRPIERPRERKILRFPAFAVVGWAVAAAAAFGFFVELSAVQRLTLELDRVRQRESELALALAEERQWAASMAAAGAKVAYFAPTEAGEKTLAGWAVYDPETRRAVLVLENLLLEPGHDYELWAIRGAGPRSLGVIEVTVSGRALVRLESVERPEDLSAFAISYEDEGGSPDPQAPAGPVVMVGAL